MKLLYKSKLRKLKKVDLVGYLLLASIIPSVLFCIIDFAIIRLSENQIMYFFSAGAQVVAALFALTLAGNVFHDNKLDKMVEKDPTYEEAVEVKRAENFQTIRRMGMGCFAAVALSLLNIELLSFLGTYRKFHIYFINQATCLLFIEALYIIMFVIDVVNPKSIRNIMDVGKKEIEADLADSKKSKTESVKQKTKFTQVDAEAYRSSDDFSEFLMYYNKIEETIYKTASEIFPGEFTKSKEYNRVIIQALQKLLYSEVINYKTVEEFNYIRKYRNYTVHSQKPSVTKEMNAMIRGFYKTLIEEITDFKNNRMEKNIDWKDISNESKSMTSIKHDGIDLYIKYRSGAIYKYYAVPRQVYEQLMNYDIDVKEVSSFDEAVDLLLKKAGFSYTRVNDIEQN